MINNDKHNKYCQKIKFPTSTSAVELNTCVVSKNYDSDEIILEVIY